VNDTPHIIDLFMNDLADLPWIKAVLTDGFPEDQDPNIFVHELLIDY